MALTNKPVRFQRSETVEQTQRVLEDRLKTTNECTVPPGGIIMWSGSIASIPSGWLLCDGTKGTPDLRDRFIVGAGTESGSAVSGTAARSGGSTTSGAHTLTTPEIPAHAHNIKTDAGAGAIWTIAMVGPARAAGNTYYADAAGGGGAHTHAGTIPPYYALAFIMKA